MAKVIDELLIAVGVKNNEKEFKQVQDGFDSIKSSALQLGATIAGGLSFDAITGEIIRAGKEWDAFAKDVRAFDLEGAFTQKFDYVVESQGGGDTEGADFQKMIQQTKGGIRTGDLGFTEELSKVTGMDWVSVVKNNDVDEVISIMNEQISKMSKAQQQAALNVIGGGTGIRNALMLKPEDFKAGLEGAKRLGLILEENQTTAENFTQSITDMNMALAASSQDDYALALEVATGGMTNLADMAVTKRTLGGDGKEQTLYDQFIAAAGGGEMKATIATQSLKYVLEAQDYISDMLTSDKSKPQAGSTGGKSTVVNQTVNVSIDAKGMNPDQLADAIDKRLNYQATESVRQLSESSQ